VALDGCGHFPLEELSHMVDVGGDDGTLLAAILSAHPAHI
jgi:hypothetical protein